jgi:hypothetical protein
MQGQDENPLGFENWQRGENKNKAAYYIFDERTNSGGFIRPILLYAQIKKSRSL